jgi:hypothetical protein
MLNDAHQRDQLQFFGKHTELAELATFQNWIKPLRKLKWFVYAKRPFAGPEAVLEYLSRYTHRVAIANSRLIKFDNNDVTFKYKDYRANGHYRQKVMTLTADEFIRRFLIHVLPGGFHRIRHYGIFANRQRADNLSKARELLHADEPMTTNDGAEDSSDEPASTYICRVCSGPMIVIEILLPDHAPRAPPTMSAVE